MKSPPDLRQAAVAGMFYTADGRRLVKEIEGYIAKPAKPRAKAFGVMVPHAGYRYSGAICGRALASVEIPERVVILHTKHQAGGGVCSLAQFDAWQTPLGVVETEEKLQAALEKIDGLTASNAPHTRDHAAEVVLPFLQVLNASARIAVVSVGRFDSEDLAALGVALAGAIQAAGGALIVSSSDMNHYDSHEATLAKDEGALKKLAAFDAAGLIEVCERDDISMCGVYATALMLEACRALGASRVELLEHTTSGPTSGDYDQVVGYASARVL